MEEELKEALELTNEINELETHLSNLRGNRRLLMIGLRKNKVTARKISDVLGMSEQNVHKIVKSKNG